MKPYHALFGIRIKARCMKDSYQGMPSGMLHRHPTLARL